MSARRRATVAPQPCARGADGDVASEAHRNCLVLASALRGLMLEEFVFDHTGWVERITPLWMIACDVEHGIRSLYQAPDGEEKEV